MLNPVVHHRQRGRLLYALDGRNKIQREAQRMGNRMQQQGAVEVHVQEHKLGSKPGRLVELALREPRKGDAAGAFAAQQLHDRSAPSQQTQQTPPPWLKAAHVRRSRLGRREPQPMPTLAESAQASTASSISRAVAGGYPAASGAVTSVGCGSGGGGGTAADNRVTREQLLAFYRQHDPSKVANIDTVLARVPAAHSESSSNS